MESLINIYDDKCTVCYACVRSCPVKAIKVTHSGHPPIHDPKRCISCGACVRVCKFDAIEYRQNWKDVENLLEKNSSNLIALLDPSYVCEFAELTDARKLVGMLHQLGFSEVFDTSFAIDLLAKHYHNYLIEYKGKYYILANCPVVVAYVEKFKPSLINNLVPFVTPMNAMAKILRQLKGNDFILVYFTPCIAAKEEVKLQGNDNIINYVLTFEELRILFDRHQLTEKMVEFRVVQQPIGRMGYIYPISNGIVQAANISESLIENLILTGEGSKKMIEYVSEFEKHTSSINCHLNLFYCEGCIGGPGFTADNKYVERRETLIEYARKQIKNMDKIIFEQNIERYCDLEISRTFHIHYESIPVPTEEKIREILTAIGKPSEEDEIDCRACGYDSCRDFAIAVAQGLTTTDMCITYSLKNQNSYTRALKATNEKLARMQEALIESEKKTKMEQEQAREASETLSAMFQKLRAGIVIFDQHLKILKANKSFIDMLGDDVAQINEIIPELVGADLRTILPKAFVPLASFVLENNEEILNKDIHTSDGIINISIFPIKKGKIAGSIIRDPYQPDVRKEEIINRLNEVINRHLDMVQKIGYLLGEGASETEQMLNSIIKTFKNKEEK